jgi:hypothetical protein
MRCYYVTMRVVMVLVMGRALLRSKAERIVCVVVVVYVCDGGRPPVSKICYPLVTRLVNSMVVCKERLMVCLLIPHWYCQEVILIPNC